jgi:transposase-like protein
MGPLRPETISHVQDFLRCGDLATGFTRFLCPDCGHQHLLAFTCKSRHFCPACHQRRTLQIGTWIATAVCQPVPHRQYVFTIPKMLRGIFRKRRHLLHHLLQVATTRTAV